MKDLDKDSRLLEKHFGLISGGMLYGLWQASVKQGSKWDIEKPETMDIVINGENADEIYSWCKAIGSGYAVGMNKGGMRQIKEAKSVALSLLKTEANDPLTPITRKIELVKLTSKGKPNK